MEAPCASPWSQMAKLLRRGATQLQVTLLDETTEPAGTWLSLQPRLSTTVVRSKG